MRCSELTNKHCSWDCSQSGEFAFGVFSTLNLLSLFTVVEGSGTLLPKSIRDTERMYSLTLEVITPTHTPLRHLVYVLRPGT